MTVYIDVLLLLDLYINYFLIRGTSLLLHRDISAKRTLTAAAIGAVFSLTILLPQLPFILNALIRSVSGAVITLAAFGYRRLSDFIIDMLCFLVISFMYAGLMGALWLYGAPFGMYYHNGTAYFDIPMIVLAALTAAAYAVVRFLRYLSDKRTISTETAKVEISYNATTVTLQGIPDTGNSLCDPFSGTPVMICELSVLKDILPENIRSYISGNVDMVEGIRLVPCRTVGGSALIPVFKADSVSISGKRVSVLVGVSKSEMGAECIFDPKLISI